MKTSIGGRSLPRQNPFTCIPKTTKTWQHELEPQGVSVTCLIPGATFTEFSRASKAHRAMAFNVPGLAMPADRVARAGVEGMVTELAWTDM